MARISRGGFANQLKKIPFSSTPMGRWGGIVAYQDGGRRRGLGVHQLDRRPLHFGGCLDGRHESSMLPPAPRGGVSVVPKTNAVFLQTFAQTIGRAPVRSFAGCLTPGHEAFDGRARKKRGPHFPDAFGHRLRPTCAEHRECSDRYSANPPPWIAWFAKGCHSGWRPLYRAFG